MKARQLAKDLQHLAVREPEHFAFEWKFRLDTWVMHIRSADLVKGERGRAVRIIRRVLRRAGKLVQSCGAEASLMMEKTREILLDEAQCIVPAVHREQYARYFDRRQRPFDHKYVIQKGAWHDR